MTVFQATDVKNLVNISKQNCQLAIVKRKSPEEADIFFQKLTQTPFRVIAHISKKQAREDILSSLENILPQHLKNDPFYDYWISDMAEICCTFCEILDSNKVGFCLGTERGCSRYHIDYVPMRLLVTYAGKGTEWLPDDAADRIALTKGQPNEIILKNPSARQFMNHWDIAIFRGGPKGLLHRTPDEALDKPSLLMRLDHATFWDTIFEQQDNSLPHAKSA